jgi:hypothetical protein
LTESGYTGVLAGGVVEESNSSEKKATQEEQKEAVDESKVTSQVKENNGANDNGVDDDSVVDDEEGASSNEKKQKPPSDGNQDQHARESPKNDIQKAIAEHCTGPICGGGLAIVLVLSLALFCYGCYKCCCVPKMSKVPAVAYTEVELSNGYKDGGGTRGYKDEFVDEEDENDDDDAEYGVTNGTQ